MKEEYRRLTFAAYAKKPIAKVFSAGSHLAIGRCGYDYDTSIVGRDNKADRVRTFYNGVETCHGRPTANE